MRKRASFPGMAKVPSAWLLFGPFLVGEKLPVQKYWGGFSGFQPRKIFAADPKDLLDIMRLVQVLALAFATVSTIDAVRRPYIIGKLAVDQGWAVHDRVSAPFRFTSSISLDAGNIDWLCPYVKK